MSIIWADLFGRMLNTQLSEGSVIKKLKRSFGMRRKRECIRIFFRLCCWLPCKDGGRRSSFRSDEFCVSGARTEFAANRRTQTSSAGEVDDVKRYSSSTWTGGRGVVVGYLDSFRHGMPPNGTFFSDGMETVAVIKAEHRFSDANYF